MQPESLAKLQKRERERERKRSKLGIDTVSTVSIVSNELTIG
jgi:hypothetical protein